MLKTKKQQFKLESYSPFYHTYMIYDGVSYLIRICISPPPLPQTSCSAQWLPGLHSEAPPCYCRLGKRRLSLKPRGGRCSWETPSWRPAPTAVPSSSTTLSPCGSSDRRRCTDSDAGRASSSPPWRRRDAPSLSCTSSATGSCRILAFSFSSCLPLFLYRRLLCVASRDQRRKTRSSTTP